MARLCSICQSIDWKLLRYPVESEIPHIQAWNLPRDKFPYISDADTRQVKITIGYLADIRTRIACALCSYIWEALAKTGIYTSAGRSRSGDYPVICRADIGRQVALFRYPYKDSNDTVTLYQLAITTYLEGHPRHDNGNEAHYFMDNHFQMCDVGSGSVQVDEHLRDPRPDVDMTVFGGRVRPHKINLHWLKRWLWLCENEHGEICNALLAKPDVFQMPSVRFIDVNKKCVVTLKPANLATIRYAALSYVWGKPPDQGSRYQEAATLELSSTTYEFLHTPGCLCGEDVPKTIADMLDLTAALDIPYVWIDRLCIIQNNNEDKVTQLANMHAIYNAAFVTVVAAAGDDVHHGLPGLRPGTRHAEQKEIPVLDRCPSSCTDSHLHERQGLSLLTCLEPYLRSTHFLEKTNWFRRGWTMQERILSRRNLIFTQEQVRFTCTDATFLEETYCELPFPRMQTFSQSEADHGFRSSVRVYGESSDPEARLWARFQRLVLRYSTRSLSFEGDVHDAFAAITQALAIEAKDEFLWGIPLSQFEIGLSWNTFNGLKRRNDITSLPMTDKNCQVEFPSWSWMGWMGQTCIAVGRTRTETEKPTIQCYIHYQTEEGIKLDTIQHATPASRSWKPRINPEMWKMKNSCSISLADVKKHVSAFNAERLYDIPANHVLFFWTNRARFRVSRPVFGSEKPVLHEPGLNFVCTGCYTAEQHLSGAAAPEEGFAATPPNFAPNILNADGHIVGTLCRMRPEFWQTGSYDDGIHDFIVVGRRYVEELADFYPATLLIMQVEERAGIWFRINIGEIAESDWDKAGSEWKLIILG